MTRYYNFKLRAWTELEGAARRKCACGFVLTFVAVGDEIECPDCGKRIKYTGRKEVRRTPAKRDRQRAKKAYSQAVAGRKRQRPITVLAFDDETTYDIYQNLNFGSYLLAWIDPGDFTFHPYEEGLFYADDLPETDPEGFQMLKGYWEKGRPRPNEGKLIAPQVGDFPQWWYENYPDEALEAYASLKASGAVSEDDPRFIGWHDAHRELIKLRNTERLSQEVKNVFSAASAMYEPAQIERWKDEMPHIQGMLGSVGADSWQPDRWLDSQGIEHHWPNRPYSSRVSYGRVREARIERGMPRLADEELKFMPASAFANDVLYEVCFPKYSRWGRKKAGEPKPATLVTANGASDLSRLSKAVKAGGPTGSKFAGGFSMRLLPTEDEEVDLLESPKHGNNVRLVRRGARGTMFGFSDLEPGDRDYYTDVLNLGWSLTNQVYSLDSLSQMYATEHRKSETPDFSAGITEYQITYNRDDVMATLDSYCGLLREVNKHTESFDETRAYSPAALPKAYYNDMGIRSPLEKMPNFSREVLGHSMTTFFAGRAEAHIRRVPDIPVGYYDFTSMYPTVNVNMGLWQFLTCREIYYLDQTEDMQAFLDSLTLDDMFRPESWLKVRGIGLVQPSEDVLPVRTRFAGDTDTIATAYVTGETEDDALWWSMPDLVLSKLLTGKAPSLTRGIRFEPSKEQQDGLQPVTLGQRRIDPRTRDFFKLAVEERQLVKKDIKANGHGKCACELADAHSQGCQCEDCHGNCVCSKCSLSSSLKVTASSGSYGIFAEMNQEPNSTVQHRKDYKPPKVKVYGVKDDSLIVDSDKRDVPGPYAFPPMATLITGAARLMLGMLEKCVSDAGGTWVSCDTDSMTIPVTEQGGTVQTTGGPIPAISRGVMQRIQERFDSLNPYSIKDIHILKREHEPTEEDPRQLYIYAISAKRYALWRYRPDGTVEVVPGEGRKEHGLGAYLSPHDPNSEAVQKGSRQHVTEIWEYLISRALGKPVPEPSFFDLPVMCKVTVSTWSSYDLFKHFNGTCKKPCEKCEQCKQGADHLCACHNHHLKPYRQQIKPYNFAMSPVVYSRPSLTSILHGRYRSNGEGKSLRLIAPYERDPSKWLELEYVDASTGLGDSYCITTEDLPGHIQALSDAPVRVMTWRDVTEAFDVHPEVKYCDSEGKRCSADTIGILQRHHIKIGYVSYIGKESNRLTEKDEPLPDLAPYEVPDYGSGRDDVRELVIPILRANGFESRQASGTWHGLSRRKLAEAISSSEGRQVGEYLDLDNLTHVSPTLKRHIRDPLIMLAVRLALSSIPDGYKDTAWCTRQGQHEYCWEILDTWRRTCDRHSG